MPPGYRLCQFCRVPAAECLCDDDTESETKIMDFGGALTALKAGSQVARHGWNGKGMFVAYQAGYPDGIAINANTAKATGIPQGTVCAFRPYLMLKTADDEFVPWVASQSDLLADDWFEV